MSKMHNDQLLTIKQVAWLTQLHRRTVTRMIAQGKLRAIDVRVPGGKRATWRIPAKAVEEWLDSAEFK